MDANPLDRGAGSEFVPNSTARASAGLYFVIGLFGPAAVVMGDSSPALLAATAFLWMLAARAWRSGIATTDSGFISRNETPAKRFSWSEVKRFEHRPYRGIGAWLTDGRWVPLQYCPEATPNAKRLMSALQAGLDGPREGA